MIAYARAPAHAGVRLDRLDRLDFANVYAGLEASNPLSVLFGLDALRTRATSLPIPGREESCPPCGPVDDL